MVSQDEDGSETEYSSFGVLYRFYIDDRDRKSVV